MKTTYSLPNGKLTVNAKVMSKAWKKLYTPFCNSTGSFVMGFSPGVQFCYGNKSFSLPVSVLEKLNKYLPN